MGARTEHSHDEGLNGSVAAVLRGERIAAGLTIDELAELSGVPAVTVQRLLTARRSITMETLDALSHALGQSPAEVVARAILRDGNPDVVSGVVTGIRRVMDEATSKDEDNGAHPVGNG